MTTKKAIVPDILLKLSNVYKEDLYFIDSMYCIGGFLSNDQAVGKTFCILDKDRADDIRDYFGDITAIYIKNVKKAKEFYSTEFEYEYINSQLEEKQKKELREKRDDYLNAIKTVKEWKTFDFSDEELTTLLEDNKRIVLFKDDKNVPELEVSKCVFPMLNKKNIDSLMYSIGKTKNIKNAYTVIISITHEYFQVYNFIRYIDIDKN